MESDLNTFAAAQKKCWEHIEVATQMVGQLDALKEIRVKSVIPIISDNMPMLMITPECPDDIVKIKILCHCIRNALKVETEWEHIPRGDEWLLRLKIPPRTYIDVMTSLPSVIKAAPLSL